ncbi:hypothetical protein HYH03_016520 [Edaphochlamys debaryana]|uniref:Protein kinase domain-containing protein n=1 Tax=Edaphochlamys debaryana TaxID=47281 RepID=A0A836BPU1_9CHLO|nr:hypothetical protein HYH03_016520 [Edaphochlamys debaryana]|eukprot:KAG2484691.1 hypothetical protein HYH03_016520 [Edaphochlamys debaryana]
MTGNALPCGSAAAVPRTPAAAPVTSGASLAVFQRQRQRLASALVTGAEGVAAAASGMGAQAAEPSPKRQRRQAPSHLTVQVSASALSAAGSARTLPLDVSALQQQRAVVDPAAAVQAPAPAYQLPLQWGPSYQPPPYSPQVSGLQGPLAQPAGWSFPPAPTVSSISSGLQTPSPRPMAAVTSPMPTPAASASAGASPSLAPTAGPAAAEELWWAQPEFLAYLSVLGERPQEPQPQPQPHIGAEWLGQHLTAEWQQAGADPSGSLASAFVGTAQPLRQPSDVASQSLELSQLSDVLRACSAIPGSSYAQLSRICAILADHFKVAYVSASVLSSTGITCLPVVAGGRAAHLCPVGLPQFLDASEASSFYLVAGQQRFLRRCAPEALPPDWDALREAGGLTAFLAAGIALGPETVAVLTLADEAPGRFEGAMWQPSLELVCAFMGHLFRDRLLVGYCGVVEELMAVDSLDELVRTLSRCIVRLLSEKQHQMRLTCRIACVSSDASSAIIFDESMQYASVVQSAVGGEDSPALNAAQLARAHGMPYSLGGPMQSYGGGGGGGLLVTATGEAGMPGAGEAGGGGGAPGMALRGRYARASLPEPLLGPGPAGAGPGPGAGLAGPLVSNPSLVTDPAPGPLAEPSLPEPQLNPPSQLVSPVHPVLASLHQAGAARSGAPSPQAQLPTGHRLQSTGAVPGLLGPGGRVVGGASSISQPGLVGPTGGPAHGGGAGSLMGDVGREAALWGAMDHGNPSNFSQHQLQMEGQTYLVENTLLAEALSNRAGVWIGDCLAFMQNPSSPSTDVFLAATAHHTTAMILEVMWERCGGAAAGAALGGSVGPGGGGLSAGVVREVPLSNSNLRLGVGLRTFSGTAPNGQRRPSSRLAVGGRSGNGYAASLLMNAPLSNDAVSSGRIPSATAVGGAAAAAGGAAAAAGGAAGAGGPVRGGSGGGAPPAAGAGTAGAGAGGGGGGGGGGVGSSRPDMPLLAAYVLTSGSAPPSVLQELLVGLRELLAALEPLVASKLSEELGAEWQQLQREVLDRGRVARQPKDRTIVLRTTAAQLALNSHGSVDEYVTDAMRPSSPRVGGGGPAAKTTSGNVGGLALGLAAAGGGGGGGGGSEGGGRGPGGSNPAGGAATSLAVRSTSDKTLGTGAGAGTGTGTGAGGIHSGRNGGGTPIPGAGGAGAGTGGGAVLVGSPGGGGGGLRVRTPSFMMSKSFTGKRMSALISGVQDRVQQAQRMSVSYNTLFSRPDDLRSVTMLEKLGSGGFGTVYLGMYQSTEVAVKVILERDCEGSEVFRNAVELAVLSTLSHPNIVQVLTFFTDVTVQIPPVAARISGAAPPIYLFPHEPSTMQLDLTPVPSAAAEAEADSEPGGLLGAGGASGASGGQRRSGSGNREAEGGEDGGEDGDDAGGGGRASDGAEEPGAALGPIAAAAGGSSGRRQPLPRLGPLALAAGAGVAGGGAPPKQPLPCGPPAKKALVILMEFCDMGCLADAIRNGVFKEKVKGGYGALQPAWAHIYLTLLEVALALKYLHSINLVHRDLKPQNVLLKTSPSDVRGFVAKLSDFGLVKLLTESDMVAAAAAATVRRRRRYSGTVTHVAPEAIAQGQAATPTDVSADIYAFGIVMWEVLTGQPVYMGLNSDQIIERVQNEGLRPTFPPDTPSEFSSLANRCWDVDPRRRPSADELVQQMSALSSSTRSHPQLMAARRRLSTLSNKELVRQVANANIAAANAGIAAMHGVGNGAGMGGGGYGGMGAGAGSGMGGGGSHALSLLGTQQAAARQGVGQGKFNEDDFPLHIL